MGNVVSMKEFLVKKTAKQVKEKRKSLDFDFGEVIRKNTYRKDKVTEERNKNNKNITRFLD